VDYRSCLTSPRQTGKPSRTFERSPPPPCELRLRSRQCGRTGRSSFRLPKLCPLEHPGGHIYQRTYDEDHLAGHIDVCAALNNAESPLSQATAPQETPHTCTLSHGRRVSIEPMTTPVERAPRPDLLMRS